MYAKSFSHRIVGILLGLARVLELHVARLETAKYFMLAGRKAELSVKLAYKPRCEAGKPRIFRIRFACNHSWSRKPQTQFPRPIFQPSRSLLTCPTFSATPVLMFLSNESRTLCWCKDNKIAPLVVLVWTQNVSWKRKCKIARLAAAPAFMNMKIFASHTKSAEKSLLSQNSNFFSSRQHFTSVPFSWGGSLVGLCSTFQGTRVGALHHNSS